MQLPNEVTIAMRLVTDLWSSRRARRQLRRMQQAMPSLSPRSIQIAVYFADSAVNLYQIRQWYAPLATLAKIWPVAIISRSPASAVALMQEGPVPVVYLRQVIDLEAFIDTQDLKIVLYVNQNSRNFQMMRYSRMWHVFINHGESDKMYMTTNQFKAYDYSLIAGQAAADRLGSKLWGFDVDTRTIRIGRPQADHLGGTPPYTPDDRTVVLYAPTWEGDRGAAAYGSIATHGVALVRALVATGRHRVIYRPHPRSGVVDPEYRRANETIIDTIAAANSADRSAQHVFDDGPGLDWQLAAADVAISDISAMVYDRLATGRPLIVTRPVSPLAEVDESGYLGDAEWLTAHQAADVVTVIDHALKGESLGRFAYWVTHHFGDTTPGAATERFHDAIRRLVERWDTEAAKHPSSGPASE